MSGYYVRRPDAQGGAADETFAAIAEEYPGVAWLLRGRAKDHPEGLMLPLSLILFLEAGRLKFCFSNKNSTDCIFGTVDKPEAILGSVEAAVREGRMEWKKTRR